MPLGRENDSGVERRRWEETPMRIAAADGEREMMPAARERWWRWKQMSPVGRYHAAGEREMTPLVVSGGER